MKNNKKSKIIIMLAWLFILWGILGLIGMNPSAKELTKFLSQEPDQFKRLFLTYISSLIYLILRFLIPASGILAGIYMLKLENWSRKLAITLRIISIPLLIVTFYTSFNRNLEKAIRESEREIVEQKLDITQIRKNTKKRMVVTVTGVAVLAVCFNGAIVYFLTRPKIKEQFKEIDINV